MRLAAFAKTPAGIFQIYDHDTDWQVIGPNFERWVSTWSHDRAASLNRAAALIPEPKEIIFTDEINQPAMRGR